MGHSICAIISQGPVRPGKAEYYSLPVFGAGDYVIIGLDDAHADHWAIKTGIGFMSLSDMAHDTAITQHFAKELGLSEFALIHTDYFGGCGSQWATVYRDGARVLEVSEGGINRALALIGVQRSQGSDEFETVGLTKYRSFEDSFEEFLDRND